MPLEPFATLLIEEHPLMLRGVKAQYDSAAPNLGVPAQVHVGHPTYSLIGVMLAPNAVAHSGGPGALAWTLEHGLPLVVTVRLGGHEVRVELDLVSQTITEKVEVEARQPLPLPPPLGDGRAISLKEE